MMHMTFYWGREVTILFDSWHTKSWLGYSLSLLACILASAFYQYLENHRMRLKISASKGAADLSPDAQVPLIQRKLGGGGGGGPWSCKLSAATVGGSALFGLNSAIGYMLMLAVMSFNGGVFVAIVVGLGLGYLLFRSDDENMVIQDESCACA
ncbi:Copper transporter 5 [Linum perenne]